MPTTQLTPAAAGAPAAYDGFDRMLLNGRWTHGRSGQSLEDVDPYTNEVLLRIPLADQADLDDAFEAAAAAQPDWSRAQPARRAAVLRRAAAIMESRRAEIVDWIVHERPRLAEVECDLVVRVAARDVEVRLWRAVTRAGVASLVFEDRLDVVLELAEVRVGRCLLYTSPSPRDS